MDLALLLFGLFWGLFGKGNGAAGGATTRPESPSPPWGGPQPAPGPAAPWPAVTPTGLPPFPGSGWEYDEPPPKAVQERARQLLHSLWAQGQGTFRIEQTAGRWIAYRSEITRGNKRGVVAYRERRALPPAPRPPPPPRTVAPRPPPPPESPPWGGPRAVSAPAPAPARVVPGATPAAPPTVLQLPTLRLGMGLKPAAPLADVRLLQTKLGIAADGRFGQDTLRAVKEFQRRRGLDPDGVVGPKTWTALFGSSGG